MILVELCAGSAAVSLRWLSGRAVPPIGYMGGKRAYADAILTAMGLQPGGGRRDGRVILVEPGPWGEAWALWRTAEGRRDTCDRLRAWAGEDPRELWTRLKSAPVPTEAAERVATWAVLQFWNFGVKAALHRDGKWRNVSASNKWDGGEWRSLDGRVDARRPLLLPLLIGELESLSDLSRVQVITADAVEIEPIPGAVCYIDPPYAGTTGYGWQLDRAAVLSVAARWRAAGATVCVSETEPLPLDGWHSVALPPPFGRRRTFSKQQSEYLTLSRPAAGQQPLFGAA